MEKKGRLLGRTGTGITVDGAWQGRHYQFYPFINLGHFYMAKSDDPKVSAKYKEFLKMGLESLKNRAADDPFIYGVPFLWCSNNLVSAAITHACSL